LSAKETMLNSILSTAEMPDVNFNPAQQHVIDVVNDQIIQTLTPTNSVVPKLVIVQGKGGK